uniref:Uncharacterized protein n=1 Tax=Kalanchoe fedtschenkoi TaxID=63787 RepID=A0A7N0TZE2_KALFE
MTRPRIDFTSDERSIRRLRRHSTQNKYMETFLKPRVEEEPADDTFAIFLKKCYVDVSEDESSGFQVLSNNNTSDSDPQLEKFFRCLKKSRNSYVLDTLKADGTSLLLRYENDDLSPHQFKHNTSQNGMVAREAKAGMPHHLSVTAKRTIVGSAGLSSFRGGKSSGKIDGPEVLWTSPELFEEGYYFYLMKMLQGNSGELGFSQDSENHNEAEVAANVTQVASRNHALASNYHSVQVFDKRHEKRPRLSQNLDHVVNKTMTAEVTDEATGKHTSGMYNYLRQKLDKKQEKRSSQYLDLENCVQMTKTEKVTQEATGLHTSNYGKGKAHRFHQDVETVGRKSVVPKVVQQATDTDVHLSEAPDYIQGKRRRVSWDSEKATKRTATNKVTQEATGLHVSNAKKCESYRLTKDFEPGGRSVPPKVGQEATSTDVHFKETLDDEQRKRSRRSGYSEKATKSTAVGTATREATGIHRLHANPSSRMKAHPNNHHQLGNGFSGTESELGGLVDDSYQDFLNGLSGCEGRQIFHSCDGQVVTYEKCSSDSDSNSDSVIIIGDSEKDLKNSKYSSFVPRNIDWEDWDHDERRIGSDSTFRKELKSLLSKPYNKKEHDSLMEEVRQRKPLQRYRDLRGGRVATYELEILGQSYLDRHENEIDGKADGCFPHHTPCIFTCKITC